MLPQQHQKITTRGVRGMILARLDTGPSAWLSDIVMRVTSDQAVENYAWLGGAPALREFIGGRTPAELAENSFTISNKDYEGSILIKSKDMRRDKLGMITVRVNQLADRANDHPAKLVSGLILAAESSLCYDGQYFFDTDHAEGKSGAQSNDITSGATTPAAPTVAEFSKAVMSGIQQMYTLKDDQGEPMNQSATEFQVQVPVTFMAVALEAVTALLGDGGKSQTIPALKGKFTITVVPNPRLTWTTKFAIFRTDEAAKPFILQEEDIPDVVALGEGSEFEQLNKEQLFGIDWTGNVGYGYWQFGVLVTFT
ncbi:Mu-like prophage major head subunit gpT family protein [Shinella zoogloeoides]|uniref:Mu-like prophage major head subunit gpT family protein n=1 Tax=Shinella zoogloeoides TaxID=352475 RepID=UPI00273DE3DE|nr:Mu-like prophage major head subunit gpT family protein [Shinella zoogloeoides]WLR92175.1 Mu-like prophage major head subunit gpT family protein [Shinella zoogloeoides]